ncbi:MAG: hypothetical protein ACRD3J_08660 [Thermoanaerobaculia bacterium]
MSKSHSSDGTRPSDAVARYMRSRGVSGSLVEDGLEGAIDRWDALARSARDYDFTLDDWLNDMDLRDIIEGAMQAAGQSERESVAKSLAKADERMKKATVQTGSIWGKANAASENYDPLKSWWYFRRPKHPGEDMQSDLVAAGLA